MINPWALALGWMLSASCLANGAAIAQAGAGAAPACQTCHGAAGEGMAAAGFPRLAGLGAPYMLRQLAAFADGSRVSEVMMPIAKALSQAQREQVSAHYAALPVVARPAAVLATTPTTTATTTPTTTPTPALASPASSSASASAPVVATAGSVLATRGRWASQLPACEQCHGPGGRGVGPDFPPLAGQSAAYLAQQLSAWKSGQRPPGPMGLMATVAKKLSDAEVLAVAEHYAALPAKGTP